MVLLTFSPELKDRCPDFAVGLLSCNVEVLGCHEGLWREVEALAETLRGLLNLEDINRHPVIAATRKAYKACGKDPNRYRPSAEALRRRVVQGKGLYRVHPLVDIINLVSLRSGFSIGGFDAERIDGDLSWGIGRPGEPFEGIGRGRLNIAGLPVLRDCTGPIGTPTSDHVRTRLEPSTQKVLLNLNSFGGPAPLPEAMEYAGELLSKYARARETVMRTVS
jgi:DNA/RNA-binding domain of Phe-tRNA-synthetase-like protein